MFCSKCGASNPEGASFCQICGQPITEPQQAQPEPQPIQTPPEPVSPQPPMQPQVQQPYSSHPVLNAVKSIGASPLFLVAVIAFTASILFGIASAAMISNTSATILEIFRDTAVDMGIWYDVQDLYYELAEAFTDTATIVTVVISTLIASLPQILIAVGLWMIYSTAINRSSDRMNTGGFTLVKIITIIQMVCMDIALVAGAIGTVIAMITLSALSGYGLDEDVATVFIIVAVLILVILIIVAVLANLFYAKAIQSIDTATSTIYTALPSDKVSSYVAVMLFIEAFFSLGGLISLGGIFGILETVATIVSLVCFGAVIFKYKNTMRKLMA